MKVSIFFIALLLPGCAFHRFRQKDSGNSVELSPLNASPPAGGFLKAVSCTHSSSDRTHVPVMCVEVRSRKDDVIEEHRSRCSRSEYGSGKVRFDFDVCKNNASLMCRYQHSKNGTQWLELRYYSSSKAVHREKAKQDCIEIGGKLTMLSGQ